MPRRWEPDDPIYGMRSGALGGAINGWSTVRVKGETVHEAVLRAVQKWPDAHTHTTFELVPPRRRADIKADGKWWERPTTDLHTFRRT